MMYACVREWVRARALAFAWVSAVRFAVHARGCVCARAHVNIRVSVRLRVRVRAVACVCQVYVCVFVRAYS